ncbi:hypothetical protein [Gordonia metallireducens]|nr:hypothetical protein [Gordonia metallireducens]
MRHKAEEYLLDQLGTYEDAGLYGAVVKAEANVRNSVALTSTRSAR